MLENKKINLDLPIDAYDAEGNLKEKPGVSEEGSAEVSQTEEKKEVVDDKKIEKKDEGKEEDDEQRVPYSRFSKVRQEREDAIKEADEAKALLREITEARQAKEEQRESPATSTFDEDAYVRELKRLYGDTPETREIIRIQLERERIAEERAERRALQAVENARNYETQAVTQNETVIDRRLEDFTDSLGRPLTEKEEEALLDIVDEYTPTGQDGKYIGELLPFDKAWEVFELRQQKAASSTKKSRSAAVAASGSSSQGEPSSNTAEQNRDWNPLNWNSYNNRIKGY